MDTYVFFIFISFQFNLVIRILINKLPITLLIGITHAMIMIYEENVLLIF